MTSLFSTKVLATCKLGQSLIFRTVCLRSQSIALMQHSISSSKSCFCSQLRTYVCVLNRPTNISQRFNGRAAIISRCTSNSAKDQSNKTAILYISAIGIFMTGMAYAGVPLYRMFCQVSRSLYYLLTNGIFCFEQIFQNMYLLSVCLLLKSDFNHDRPTLWTTWKTLNSCA